MIIIYDPSRSKEEVIVYYSSEDWQEFQEVFKQSLLVPVEELKPV
jgi:hypothetical protein